MRSCRARAFDFETQERPKRRAEELPEPLDFFHPDTLLDLTKTFNLPKSEFPKSRKKKAKRARFAAKHRGFGDFALGKVATTSAIAVPHSFMG